MTFTLISNPIKEKKILEKIIYKNTIGCYTDLKYFQDNIFYIFEEYKSYNIIKIFDIIDSSLKLICTYKFNNIVDQFNHSYKKTSIFHKK